MAVAPMKFNWDPAKEAANRRKHGVSFDLAIEVFADPFCNVEQDRVINGEQRWHAIGSATEALILLVVHTIATDTELEIRILSARKVTRRERKNYENRAH